MADRRPSAPCAAARAENYSALLAGDLARAGRTEFFAHLSGCADCQRRLLREAPELLLAAAAENLPAPAPLELPSLPVNHPLYTRIRAWQAAAMLLILIGGGALMLRRAADSSANPVLAGHSAPPAPGKPSAPEFAAAADPPAVESGADEYQIREYEAPGFDGKPAQWIRLTPAELNAPVMERS